MDIKIIDTLDHNNNNATAYQYRIYKNTNLIYKSELYVNERECIQDGFVRRWILMVEDILLTILLVHYVRDVWSYIKPRLQFRRRYKATIKYVGERLGWQNT